MPDGCGGTINCGTCTAPQTCGGGTPSNPNLCGCTPKTACPAGDNCGTVPDGCGGTVNCGTCMRPADVRRRHAEQPQRVRLHARSTTCPAGDNCGTVPDGCGGTVNCGTCTAPADLRRRHAEQPEPVRLHAHARRAPPATTAAPSRRLRRHHRLRHLHGAADLRRRRPPTRIVRLHAPHRVPRGDNCGTVPDGCGGTVNCGTCMAPQTCGGGSPTNPNVCGCTPTATCPAGDNCGSVPDGCGGTINCGTCGAGSTCTNNQCVANPTDGGGGDSGMVSDSGAAAE